MIRIVITNLDISSSPMLSPQETEFMLIILQTKSLIMKLDIQMKL